MPTYAVQDSDWDWLTEDGDALLVEAETPEEAVKKAVDKWNAEEQHFDAIHLKVAELRLVGFQGYCCEEGFDAFQALPEPLPLRGRALTMAISAGLQDSGK